MQAQTSYPQDVVEFGLFDHIAEYLEYEVSREVVSISAEFRDIRDYSVVRYQR